LKEKIYLFLVAFFLVVQPLLSSSSALAGASNSKAVINEKNFVTKDKLRSSDPPLTLGDNGVSAAKATIAAAGAAGAAAAVVSAAAVTAPVIPITAFSVGALSYFADTQATLEKKDTQIVKIRENVDKGGITTGEAASRFKKLGFSDNRIDYEMNIHFCRKQLSDFDKVLALKAAQGYFPMDYCPIQKKARDCFVCYVPPANEKQKSTDD
jgi:hypothetical protein